MNPNHTDITIVLDRSGSMRVIAPETIGGFNRFLKEQRETPGSAAVTLHQFDDQHETVYAAKPVAEAPDLTNETFVPRGYTALYDAIGRAVKDTGDRLTKNPAGKVVLVIITDGAENASKEFDLIRVRTMIEHQQSKYSWQVVFLAANLNAQLFGGAMGIPAINTLSYAHTAAGAASAFGSVSKNLRSMRVGAKASMAFEPEDIKAQADAGQQQ